MGEPTYPGAVPPERSRWLEFTGRRLRVHEWGDPERTPLVLVHGMFDHARTFDVLAPLLAERFRVVALDARGHGDSDWAATYPWLFDVFSIVLAIRSTGRPAHLVGHSRGGGQATDAAARSPDDVLRLVNIDGFGPPPEGFAIDGVPRPPRPAPVVLGELLDWKRKTTDRSGWRPYASLEALAERRKQQNSRLDHDWLRYVSFHGARETERGWVWKADPHASRGFGPWTPDWIGPGWKTVRAPMLAITGTVPDVWGPIPEPIIEQRLAHVRDHRRARVEGTGHFVHLERPRETAQVLLDFLEG